MERLRDPLHSWRLVDAAPGVASHDEAVDVALARGHATLTYGERCFELTYTAEVGGKCLLRLEEIGRLTRTGSGRSILVFARDGYSAEQRIAPCRNALDAEVLRDLDPRALQALARGLLEDAARVLERGARSP